MEMPVTVVVRDQPQRRQRGNGNDPFDQMFSDPFFDDAFAAMMGHKKEVTLGSEPDVLTVQPLPAANRPAGFAGAVGNFQIRATASPTSATAGDPLTLRLEVSGTGNFDRLTSDVLPSADGWKTYPAKNTFAPEDSAGYRGTKTFEQVVMAKDAGVKEIPALRLSFFDPESKRYETRTTAPIPVQITGAPANLAATNGTPAAATPNTPPAPAAPDLVPNKVEAGPLRGDAAARCSPIRGSSARRACRCARWRAGWCSSAASAASPPTRAWPAPAPPNAPSTRNSTPWTARCAERRHGVFPRGAREPCNNASANAGTRGPRRSRSPRSTPGSTARATPSGPSSRWPTASAIPARSSATPTTGTGKKLVLTQLKELEKHS